MNKNLTITIFGGDKRYFTAYKLFSAQGFDCKYITCDRLKEASSSDILILPIPSFDRDGNINSTDYTVYDLFSSLGSGTIVFAGKVPAIIKRIADEYKIELCDYTDNEEFNILNAVSTAEGAILTALQKTHSIICGSDFTVLGYGRIGRALSVRLRSLGANVTVGARSAVARATAASDSIIAVSIEQAIKVASSSIVFNTVPSPIINEDNINYIKNSLIIDLASIPGGLTDKAKISAGENFVHALSLPGKCFPETAGCTIYKTIISIMTEKGVTL